MNKIYNKLNEILVKNGFTFDDYRFCECNSMGEYIEDIIDLFFVSLGLQHQYEVTSCFDSPGYDCSVLSISWIDKEGLQLVTYLLESC